MIKIMVTIAATMADEKTAPMMAFYLSSVMFLWALLSCPALDTSKETLRKRKKGELA